MFFSVDAWGDGVGVGVSEARYCTMGGVAKVDTDVYPYVVANEYICSRLGQAVGLPIPPGVIAQTDDAKHAFVSLRFGDKGQRPPPVIVDQLVADNPAWAAGIVVFDTWVLNGDRHPGNLAYSRGSIELTVFDHSHALLGQDGIVQLTNGAGKVPGYHCLYEHLTTSSGLPRWVDRVQALDPDLIADLIAPLVRPQVLTQDEADATVKFLVERQQSLPQLIGELKQQMTNITDWEAS